MMNISSERVKRPLKIRRSIPSCAIVKEKSYCNEISAIWGPLLKIRSGCPRTTGNYQTILVAVILIGKDVDNEFND
jgi:hypothetical protein